MRSYWLGSQCSRENLFLPFKWCPFKGRKTTSSLWTSHITSDCFKCMYPNLDPVSRKLNLVYGTEETALFERLSILIPTDDIFKAETQALSFPASMSPLLIKKRKNNAAPTRCRLPTASTRDHSLDLNFSSCVMERWFPSIHFCSYILSSFCRESPNDACITCDVE